MRSSSSATSTNRFRPPAPALVAMSGVSGQCGSALATKLFSQVGPSGTLTLRLVFATVALVVLSALAGPARPARSARSAAPARPARSAAPGTAGPAARRWDPRRILQRGSRQDLAVVVVFGLALAGMNLSFYESIARIPLGVAVTVEFVGPLTIAVVGSKRWTDGVWALLAAAGVLLLASGSLLGVDHHLDLAGVGFAALAGSFWATYILLNKETGKRFAGTSGLAGAMAVGALVVTPIGIAHAGGALLRPSVLGLGAVVALLSSAIPYRCELAALRRATPRAFGILLSIAPALGALAGFVILGQRLSLLELGALLLVVAANVGSSLLGSRTVATPAVRGTAVPVLTPAGNAPPPAIPAPLAQP
ncbi:MAG TPA: EamA family transporter [Acidimicrobiales bacterium]|nr:EamA family transporter [Acidimicrobiales bacterium]